ncbi:alpha/beta hydrolase-fold protein [Nocardia sp. NPDC048505]|uniref:alpha/beta hydrolase n=1 Tax=Nocardia sp. NPDC048505 TaxID=3155756 RepID=UPI0033F3098E
MELTEGRFNSTAVGREVEYRVLHPADLEAGEDVPLVLHLHGAMSSSASLDLARPLYEELARRDRFPRAVIACPSTPTAGGFYLNWPGGESWETLISKEFPEHLAASHHGPFTANALIGVSMGGYGALLAAFAEPERFAAVAAISPAIFPGETPQTVAEVNTPSVLGDLHRSMSYGTGDAGTYAENSVYARARRNAARIRGAALPVLVDCGAEDEFRLHEGAGYLGEVLTELRIGHELRLVQGAGHIGPEAEVRTRNAIEFVGDALTPRGAESAANRRSCP